MHQNRCRTLYVTDKLNQILSGGGGGVVTITLHDVQTAALRSITDNS